MKKFFLLFLFSIFFEYAGPKKDPSFVLNVPCAIQSLDDGDESDVDESLIKDPSFVLNVPCAIQFLDDGDESDVDESLIDEGREFDEDDFEEKDGKFLYCVGEKSRGVVDTEDVLTPILQSENKKTGVVYGFCKMLTDSGYEGESKSYIATHLFLNVFLNRFKSLSSRKNSCLSLEFKKALEMKRLLPLNVFARFWSLAWKRRDGATAGARRGITQSEILDYYQRLKKRDPVLAKKFREQNEQVSICQVPYRSLRETLKNHPFTKDLVCCVRDQHGDAPVYLTIADSDTRSFNGCFSCYKRLLRKYGRFDVLDAGYGFVSEEPFIQLASFLDMGVRIQTAKFFPRGVYYAEPGALSFLILDAKKTIEESFEIISEKRKCIKREYVTPQESVNLMGALCESRGELSCCFSGEKAVQIYPPLRAFKQKVCRRDGSRSDLRFNGQWDGCLKKFKEWDLSTLITVSHVSQSHANSRDWAINLLRALELPSQSKGTMSFVVKIGKKEFEIKEKVGSKIRCIAISLLSRLFSCYSPLALAVIYKKSLKEIIENYSQYKDEANVCVVAKRGGDNPLWKALDGIHTKRQLLKVLGQLIDRYVEKLDKCAQAVGTSLKNALQANLEL